MMLHRFRLAKTMIDLAEQSASGTPGASRSHALLRRLRPPETADPKSLKERWLAALTCIALVAAALVAGLVIQAFLSVPNILLVFLPAVLLAAVRYGFWAASFTSVLSILATSFFTEPRYSFVVADPGNAWALLIFLIVAAFTSSLASQIRQRAAAVSRHSQVIEELCAFSSKLAALSATDQLAREAARQIGATLNTVAVLLVPERGSLRVKAFGPGDDALDAGELLAASWSWVHGQSAGRGTQSYPGVMYTYLPLDAGHGTVGVLGIRRAANADVWGADESKLVDALRDQVAVSIDRARLAEERLETEMLAETEKLRTALLTSISHDLRTPLASILGNISSLREYGALYDEATRSEMLQYAESETIRMSRFVENLLYMTRIDAGALQPTIENVDLPDVIGSALERARKRTAHHRVHTDLSTDLPMVPVDFVLAEQCQPKCSGRKSL